ncbi:MAG: dihydrolipoamide acetyltransferase family protein, partial [Ilumatobacteraceae bacterium]
GDRVTPDTVLADVMTDKATVEISSPVTGVVTFRVGEPGEVLAVGTEFVGIELDGSATSADVPHDESADEPTDELADQPADEPVAESSDQESVTVEAASSDAARAESPETAPPRAPGTRRPTAAPAVRARAKALGIDLSALTGSGPDGRVVHADLDRSLADSGASNRRPGAAPAREAGDGVGGRHDETVIGLRRRIAERLTAAWTEIPHITYVDAVDATELEALRAELNRRSPSNQRTMADRARLTMLPFLVRAIVLACRDQPALNAHYDGPTRTLSTFDDVHVGIATQTPDGLMVPVVHGADGLGLRDLADEIARVSAAARDGSATRDELTGSTITITSLGAMGGLMTTPIINQPEVAIVGVNKLEQRPVWRHGSFEPRAMFNLSSSFDHRVIDGWDAATFVQRVKSLLELPALLFIDE